MTVLAMMYGHLLTMPTVQEELKLSEDQQTKVKEATDKSQRLCANCLPASVTFSLARRNAKRRWRRWERRCKP